MKNNQAKFVFLLLFLYATYVNGQETKEGKPKGRFYFSWGYNKDWYSKSDIHFESKSNDDFNFTVYNVKAEDRPSFGRILNSDLSIPQYIYRIGYSFARHPNMGIEIGFDHAKYIMLQDQVAHVKGKIHEEYVDIDTILTREFLRFEHTNGANFLMLNFFWKNIFFSSASGKHELFYIIKPGAGLVIPQSEVAIFNVDQNNDYHIAGYVAGLDLELHYEFNKHFLFETGMKGVFANYLNVLAVGDSRANHHFFCLEWLISIGYQFQL